MCANDEEPRRLGASRTGADARRLRWRMNFLSRDLIAVRTAGYILRERLQAHTAADAGADADRRLRAIGVCVFPMPTAAGRTFPASAARPSQSADLLMALAGADIMLPRDQGEFAAA
jgi:hypothetical protein